MTQVVGKPIRRDVLLDLLFMNKKGLVGNAMAGGSLDCSVHEMVEFRILHGRSMAISRIIVLDFRQNNSGIFKGLLGGILQVRSLEGRAGPNEMVNIQVALPLCLRSGHPCE